MAGNWWDDYAQQLAGQSGGNNMYLPGFAYNSMVGGRPSNEKMAEYRKATGNDYVDRTAYNNWDSINSRNNMLSGFVDKMSLNGVGQASGAGGNRFESGLSSAEARISDLLNNPDSIQNTAAYKFRVRQGQEALQRSLGARGMLNSGNRLSELVKFGQDMGSQEYDNQFSRLNSLLGNYSQGWTQADQMNSQNRLGWANLGVRLLPAAPTTVGNTTFFNQVK